MRPPFFSIIIPVYNRRDFLSVALASLQRQSFPDFEVVVVDDGSDDDAGSLCRGLNDSRLRYLYQEHKGVSAARNRGILGAKGGYICFLDSDDRFHSRKLEVTRTYITDFPRYRIFHTEELWYCRGKIMPQKERHKKPDGEVFPQALKLCCISPSTACIHKSIFDEVGMFDETLPACEDYDFWLRVTARHPVKLIPEVLTMKEGGHPDQLSKKYPAMDTLRIHAIKKILGDGDLTPGQKSLAAEELRNKCLIYIRGAEKRNNKEEVERYRNLIEEMC